MKKSKIKTKMSSIIHNIFELKIDRYKRPSRKLEHKTTVKKMNAKQQKSTSVISIIFEPPESQVQEHSNERKKMKVKRCIKNEFDEYRKRNCNKMYVQTFKDKNQLKGTFHITPFNQLKKVKAKNYSGSRSIKTRTTNNRQIIKHYRTEIQENGNNNDNIKQKINQLSTTLAKRSDQKNSIELESLFTKNSYLHNNGIMKESKETINQNKKNIDYVRKKLKKIDILRSIRRPMARKQYFVFGLSDRQSFPQYRIEKYIDFLWKINYANGLFVHPANNQQSMFTAYIGKGNNSCMIKGILKRRFWWVVSDKLEGSQFVWTQLKNNHYFSQQQQSHAYESIISTETSAELNEQQNENYRKIFNKPDCNNWYKHYKQNIKTQDKLSQLTYIKRNKLFKKKQIKIISKSQQLKLHNHLRCNHYIGNKKALFYLMCCYCSIKQEDVFSMLPKTFHISQSVLDPQYSKFLIQYELNRKNIDRNFKNIWIVKPGQNSNQGKGISLCYGLDDITLRLKGREKNSSGQIRTFILQKYIERPLLYKMRKFDIRHFMLLTCFNGRFRAYWYEQGYLRTSSNQYNLKMNQIYIHLTNDAIQQHSPDYGKYQFGNKVSYNQFDRYLEQIYPKNNSCRFSTHILPKMKQIGIKSIHATYHILDQNRNLHNFELLGFDFMIDEEMVPWLIEVNTNPCLELCCPLLNRLIPTLIENTFRLTVDPLFPPPDKWPNNRKPWFTECLMNENKFQLVFDEASEGQNMKDIYKETQKVRSMIGEIEEDAEIFQNDGYDNENQQDK